MNRTAILTLACAAALTAACDRVPGTDAYRARTELSGYLIDPGSAKITVYRGRGNALCGFVNAKNRMGAYVGNTPFLIDEGYPSPALWQEPTTSDYSTWSNDGSSSAGHEAYERLETGCAFKARWVKSCGAESAVAFVYNEELCKAWQAKDWGALNSRWRY